jgi:hypothetical protein
MCYQNVATRANYARAIQKYAVQYTKTRENHIRYQLFAAYGAYGSNIIVTVLYVTAIINFSSAKFVLTEKGSEHEICYYTRYVNMSDIR